MVDILKSSEIPQADSLADVIATVEAVGRGATTYQEIAASIGKVDRQGRYYRLAAEQLSLVTSTERNHATLTREGQEFLNLAPPSRQLYLAKLAMKNLALGLALEFIEGSPGSTRQDLSDFLAANGAGESIARRRSTTILNWLIHLGMVTTDGNGYYAIWRPAYDGAAMEVICETSGTYDVPALLRQLSEVPYGTASVAFQVDQAARERTSPAHESLVQRLAQLVYRRGATAMTSAYIDLIVDVDGSRHLFEAKPGGQDNLAAQIRKGVAQLLEYRFLHKFRNTWLWLILEEQPIGQNAWYIEYLTHELAMNVCWALPDGRFGTPPQCRDAWAQVTGQNQ